MTPEQKIEFQKVLDECLNRPEKLIEYSDVEWEGIIGDYHQKVGLAYCVFMEGIRFAENKYKPKHIYPDEMPENF